MEVEILPCKGCGHEYGFYVFKRKIEYWSIKCLFCGYGKENYYYTKTEAIYAWNTGDLNEED